LNLELENSTPEFKNSAPGLSILYDKAYLLGSRKAFTWTFTMVLPGLRNFIPGLEELLEASQKLCSHGLTCFLSGSRNFIPGLKDLLEASQKLSPNELTCFFIRIKKL
jgi:hypothetical protein